MTDDEARALVFGRHIQAHADAAAYGDKHSRGLPQLPGS
jgi:hypothetical protein